MWSQRDWSPKYIVCNQNRGNALVCFFNKRNRKHNCRCEMLSLASAEVENNPSNFKGFSEEHLEKYSLIRRERETAWIQQRGVTLS